jgi:hypothetical protein
MRSIMLGLGIAAAVGLSGCALSAATESGGHHGHQGHDTPTATAGAARHQPLEERRQLVKFPDAMRDQTLANMRDHLVTLAGIQQALADGRFDEASDLAENRLGMTSLALHGAHDVAAFMPEGMQAAGTAMHRSASRFAIVAREASATGELKPALGELAKVSQTCVACHAGYRLH